MPPVALPPEEAYEIDWSFEPEPELDIPQVLPELAAPRSEAPVLNLEELERTSYEVLPTQVSGARRQDDLLAEAEVFRDRWYWRDKRIASASRVWRIVYQPLTSNYRVTFAGLSQSYATRAEAFAAIRRGVSWKIADAGQIEEGARHYVEFSFRLATSLLPRPMQIGIASQSDWALSVERMQRFD